MTTKCDWPGCPETADYRLRHAAWSDDNPGNAFCGWHLGQTRCDGVLNWTTTKLPPAVSPEPPAGALPEETPQ